jgi:predicted nucleotidyltransferase component of viral defense system
MHDECVPKAAAALAPRLAPTADDLELLLGGGTACALRLGHRVSSDLDFFATGQLDTRRLLAALAELGEARLRGISAAELQVAVEDVEVFATSLGRDPLGPPDQWSGLEVLSALDLAELKVVAAVQRGMARDLCDLHLLCEAGADLGAAVRASPFDVVVALKALTDRERYERQPALDLRTPWTIAEATSFFTAEARRLLELG